MLDSLALIARSGESGHLLTDRDVLSLATEMTRARAAGENVTLAALTSYQNTAA